MATKYYQIVFSIFAFTFTTFSITEQAQLAQERYERRSYHHESDRPPVRAFELKPRDASCFQQFMSLWCGLMQHAQAPGLPAIRYEK